MTIQDRVLTLRRQAGVYTETPETLAAIGAKIAELSTEYTWRVWDKTSKINGKAVSSQAGEAYLISRGGRIIFFQTHAPGVQGRVPMNAETVLVYAQEQYDMLIATLTVEALSTPSVPDTPLDQAKAQKLSQIADARWRTETAPFYWAEKNARFDTSERSQVKYLQAAQKGKTQTWKTADGWVEMQPGDFIDLITAYETFIEELFTREATLAAQVQAAQTVPDVEAIEW